MPTDQTTRTLAANGQLLHLIVTIPPAPVARLLVLHGYGDHAGRQAHVGRWFAGHGVASVIPDFRGHGRSSGRVGAIDRWDDYLDDLSAVLEVPELAGPPLFLLAHSHGGLVAVASGLRGMLGRFSGVILSSPYLDLSLPIPLTKHVIAAVAGRLVPKMAIRSGILPNMLSSDPSMIAESIADPLVRGVATPGWFRAARSVQAEIRRRASEFKLPLLMLVPGQDVIANSAESKRFFDAAGSTDKTIEHYPAMKHEILRETDRDAVLVRILQWLDARTGKKNVREISGQS